MTENKTASPESGGLALMRSTWEAGLYDIAVAAADIAIDDLLDSGILKDIPVVGWFAKGAAVAGAVRDGLLLRKIVRFLEGAAVATDEDRQAFRDHMDDQHEARRFGEQLMLYIERHEHFDKSYVMGLVFAALVAGDITRDTYDRLNAAIDRLSAAELKQLPQYYASLKDIPEDVGHALLVAGLVGIYFTVHDLRVIDGPEPAGSGMFNYRGNELGRTLAEIISGHAA